VILLDTNAALWLQQGNARTQALLRTGQLYLSPATLLELQFLLEAGRIRLRRGVTLDTLADDERWLLDDPPSVSWFEAAIDLGWTRDPFDRLLVAHASYRRWRLATADEEIIDHLGPRAVVEV
jgi:PIN domain nuclease of toxin-antitoxin system